MMQTIEAEIDTQGRVYLLEKVEIRKKTRALVTILEDEKIESAETSLFGSMEILEENLETASSEISENFNESIKKSADLLSE